jgi:hypothetical protein
VHLVDCRTTAPKDTSGTWLECLIRPPHGPVESRFRRQVRSRPIPKSRLAWPWEKASEGDLTDRIRHLHRSRKIVEDADDILLAGKDDHNVLREGGDDAASAPAGTCE